MLNVIASIRLWLLTWAVCVVAYTGATWAFGQLVVPESADGHLVRAADGTVVGSSLLAQAFTEPHYLWPRPSAVDYAADAAGGSNLSPTSPLIRQRARTILAQYDLPADRRLPADLVTASGSGMDPHVTLGGALVQADRIAEARGIAPERVRALMEEAAFDPSGLGTGYRLVNVLEFNLALDQTVPVSQPPAAP